MTLATLVRNLGLDGAPYGFHASAQNCGDPWPAAMQFYVQLRADWT